MKHIALTIGLAVLLATAARRDAHTADNPPFRLARSTFLGGSGSEAGNGVALDSQNNLYVVGLGWTADLPVPSPIVSFPNPYQVTQGFLVKFDQNGTLVYAARLASGAYDLAVDGEDNVYITGFRFVARLTRDLSGVAYYTEIGANPSGLAVDRLGNAFVAGSASDIGFQPSNALQPTKPGDRDGFLTKVDPTGRVLFSTYLGGRAVDVVNDVAVDASGSVYVVGETNSPDFPTTPGALQRVLTPGTCSRFPASTVNCADAFVAKVAPDGQSLVYSTLLGGRSGDAATRLFVDSSGSVFVSGRTDSADFPLKDPIRSNPSGRFLARIGPTGSTLTYSTYFATAISAFAADSTGRLHIAGSTGSAGLATTGAIQSQIAGAPMFKTQNGGLTWEPLWPTGNAAGITRMSIPKRSAERIYAMCGNLITSADDGQTWRPSGTTLAHPTVVDFAADPQTTSIVYATTNGGGVFKSLDAGGTWLPINRGLDATIQASGMFGYSIVIAPSEPSTLYFGTPSGVFKSTNGGSTWIFLPVGRGDVRVVAVHPRDARTVFASDGNSLWKSTDGGATWGAPSRFTDHFGSVYQIVIDPVQPAVMYATGLSLFKSTDSGATWRIVRSVVSRFVLIPTSPPTLYATFENGRLQRSSDGGNTWVDRSSSMNIRIGALAADPSRADTLYASSAIGGDAYVAVLDANARDITYFTYLGGVRDESVLGLALDSNGTAYLTGQTSSADFPIRQGVVSTMRGDSVAFVAVMSHDFGIRPVPQSAARRH